MLLLFYCQLCFTINKYTIKLYNTKFHIYIKLVNVNFCLIGLHNRYISYNYTKSTWSTLSWMLLYVVLSAMVPFTNIENIIIIFLYEKNTFFQVILIGMQF